MQTWLKDTKLELHKTVEEKYKTCDRNESVHEKFVQFGMICAQRRCFRLCVFVCLSFASIFFLVFSDRNYEGRLTVMSHIIASVELEIVCTRDVLSIIGQHLCVMTDGMSLTSSIFGTP